MSNLAVMLGGISIVPHAGLAEQSEEPIGGESLLRLSDGAGVPMRHWVKMAGTISGQGLMPAGLDGLDFSQPLELRTTQVNSMQSAGLVFVLPGTPRPDHLPWALARVDGVWQLATCSLDVDAGVATVTVDAVADADLYQAWWMPVYAVWAKRPPKSQSTAHSWSIPWEEL